MFLKLFTIIDLSILFSIIYLVLAQRYLRFIPVSITAQCNVMKAQ